MASGTSSITGSRSGVRSSASRGTTRTSSAGPLFVEGVTSYDVERYSEDELVAIMRRLRDDDEHHADMCEAAARRFRNLVDFDGEANAIAQMVGL